LVLQDRGPGTSPTWNVPVLAGGAARHLRQELSFDRRGLVTLGPLVVSSSFPFGLARRTVELAPAQETVVLAPLGPVHRRRLQPHGAQVTRTLGHTGPHARRHPAAQADLHGLRSFRSGDSTRWIHWRTTARKGELMVREFEEAPADNLILVLEVQPPED